MLTEVVRQVVVVVLQIVVVFVVGAATVAITTISASSIVQISLSLFGIALIILSSRVKYVIV